MKKIFMLLLCFTTVIGLSGCKKEKEQQTEVVQGTAEADDGVITTEEANQIIQRFPVEVVKEGAEYASLPIIKITNNSEYYFNAQPIKISINNDSVDVPDEVMSFTAKPGSDYYYFYNQANYGENSKDKNTVNDYLVTSNGKIKVNEGEIELSIDPNDPAQQRGQIDSWGGESGYYTNDNGELEKEIKGDIYISTQPEPWIVYPGDITVEKDSATFDSDMFGTDIHIKIKNNTDKKIHLRNCRDKNDEVNDGAIWAFADFGDPKSEDYTFYNDSGLGIVLEPHEEKTELILEGIETDVDPNEMYLFINGGVNDAYPTILPPSVNGQQQ